VQRLGWVLRFKGDGCLVWFYMVVVCDIVDVDFVVYW